MELDIKGRFGVEIKDNNGNIVNKIESDNTVVDAGVLQIKRWLDRPEYVKNTKDIGHTFGEPKYWCGEKRICYWGENLEVSGAWDQYLPQKGTRNLFDHQMSTFSEHYTDENDTEYLYTKFKEPINIASMGWLSHTSDTNNDTTQGTTNYLSVKIDGYDISGADVTGYNNDEYINQHTKHNGYKHYKQEDAEYYLFVDITKTKWVLSTTLDGIPDYETNDAKLVDSPIDGNWIAVNGNITAPTTFIDEPATWRKPCYLHPDLSVPPTEDIPFSMFTQDKEYRDFWDRDSEYYVGKQPMISMSFMGFESLQNENSLYGFIPNVKRIRCRQYNYNSSNWRMDHYMWQFWIYEAQLCPQNPYVLKLGTDNGTTLSLDKTNTSLGSLEPTMEWKCDAVYQVDGEYKVRFQKIIPSTMANGITFNEIGLYMNADGHSNRKEPTLANANDLFARSIFTSSWSKTSDQTVTIYYEIGVDAVMSSSSSSSSSTT